jgi:hypothetical protein
VSLPRFFYLLVAQSPNRPSWQNDPERRWMAVGGIDRATGRETALAFTSPRRAVAFLQAAVMAGRLRDINKIPRFAAHAAREWPFLLLFDVGDAWDALERLGARLPVHPQLAEPVREREE